MMRRRDFLATVASAAVLPSALTRCSPKGAATPTAGGEPCCGPTYATPQDAIRSPRETLAFVTAIATGAKKGQPDHLAVVDVDPASDTYSQVIQRLAMPTPGDELHHYGWNRCSSCHGQPGKARRYLVVPGLTSGNIHILDAVQPTQPRLHKVIEGREVARKTNLSTPHTVHCAPDGQIVISMLGDAQGNGPGGFLRVDENFRIAGRWEKSTEGMHHNYDFWYQPRHNVMVSSEWAAPNTVSHGFKLEDVKAGKYGRRLHFWDWSAREIAQTVDLGSEGLIPLEVRFHHNPDSPHGFVGAALSSAIWHWHKANGCWTAEKVVQVEPVDVEGWPFPVPGLITDVLLSMDDRFLYFSNWLHGDIRQYDVTDPSHPKLTGRLWLGGVLEKQSRDAKHPLTAGPQMLQLSLDGRRLYVTNSLYSVWDDQFYPDIATRGSHMLQIDCDTANGGLRLNERFFVDFGPSPGGPARAHEIRFPGGDCTSDIWV